MEVYGEDAIFFSLLLIPPCHAYSDSLSFPERLMKP